MDRKEFDGLAKRLARTATRRGTVRLLTAGLLGASGLAVMAQHDVAGKKKRKKGRKHRSGSGSGAGENDGQRCLREPFVCATDDDCVRFAIWMEAYQKTVNTMDCIGGHCIERGSECGRPSDPKLVGVYYTCYQGGITYACDDETLFCPRELPYLRCDHGAGACVACGSDAECAAGYVCRAGGCHRSCRTDGDCTDAGDVNVYTCIDGLCRFDAYKCQCFLGPGCLI